MKPLSRKPAAAFFLLLSALAVWMLFRLPGLPAEEAASEPGSSQVPSPATLPVIPPAAHAGPPNPPAADPRLEMLRRAFRPEIRDMGSAHPGVPPLELEGLRIHPGKIRAFPDLSDPDQLTPCLVQLTGPIRPAWRTRLEEAGIVLYGYIPENGFHADLDARRIKRLVKEPFVQAVVPMRADFKIQPFLEHLIGLSGDERPDTIQITVTTFRPEDVKPVSAELSAMGIEVESRDAGRRWGWLRARVPGDRVKAIASLPRVQWVEERVEAELLNDQAVIGRHLNVTNVWAQYGINGQGEIIGHADTGLDVGNFAGLHPDFTGRVVAVFARGRPDRWDDPNGHGTHTAGSILGSGTMSTGLIRGVAWGAGLVHQSVISSWGGLGGLPSDLNELFLQAYTNGARIHANSWGTSVYGSYTTDSRQSDEFMWDYPEMLLVYAAGNDGWDSGDGVIDSYSIGSPASAKNVLAVGASENDRAPGSGGYSSSTYGGFWPWDFPVAPIRADYISRSADLVHQGMAAFSSRGPTDDGRIKPEVVAPGTDIVSTRSRASGAGTGWGTHPNSAYHFNGGTSMSTPLAAGSAALVRQYLRLYRAHPASSAALVKAALMHGARSLSPGQYGEGRTREIPGTTPNTVEGWGQVDVGRTLFPETKNWFFADEKTGLAAPGENGLHVFHSQTGNVAITLNYTDYPATAGAARQLVNNLDLFLEGPGGIAAPSSADRTNTAEQIKFQVNTPGVYTARVQAVNVPQGPQPYALVISGPVAEPPVILHEPLPNTIVTNVPYRVEARVISSAPLASNAVFLFWREAAGGLPFQEVPMPPVSNQYYRATIPAHPVSSEIQYFITASSSVFSVTSPPGTSHMFFVTAPLNLEISGSPGPIFSVNPNYGSHPVASGAVVNLSAPAQVSLNAGTRMAIAGWTGTGSIPASGQTNARSSLILEDSTITWSWITQFALVQTSSVPGILSATTWWQAGSNSQTLEAEKETSFEDQEYGLAGWRVDGARYPNLTSATPNPVTGLPMSGPHTAEAVYLPADQDSNGNDLPDWWEQFYFGTNAISGNGDGDADGFTNADEFRDRTNPRDAASVPTAPSIHHIALSDPRSNPAPWTVEAVVQDNLAVSNVFLFWQRNGGGWTSAPMSEAAQSNYTGMIPAPGTNGDVFVYRVEASDTSGLRSTNGPHGFQVRYPLMDAGPSGFGTFDLPAFTASNLVISITNQGLDTLFWVVERAMYYDHVENGTSTWVHAGLRDVWHIRTSRYASASHAWHFGSGPSGRYPDSADGRLDMVPVHLDVPARLVFEHWARMEYDDEQLDDHYWDGGVVELSTNNGVQYDQIFPEGGYPHRITDNPASPFPPDTPCYGKTEGWETAVFDLAAYTGQTVRLRFRFGSDAYVTEEGWYLDNLRIEPENETGWYWLDVEAAGTAAAGGTREARVTIDTSAMMFGERRAAVLVLSGNDPVRKGPILLPVALHNASREIFVTHSDRGVIDPGGSVLVLEGQGTSFWIRADAFCLIDEVQTNGVPLTGLPETNQLVVLWDDIRENGTLQATFRENLLTGGVPARWLHDYGLTNQSPAVEAVTDQDGDGMLAWQEYRAGTDPVNPASVAMVLLDVRPEENGMVLQWLSYTNLGFRYEIHGADDLMAGFGAVASNLPASPPMNVYTSPGSKGFEVYRVRISE